MDKTIIFRYLSLNTYVNKLENSIGLFSQMFVLFGNKFHFLCPNCIKTFKTLLENYIEKIPNFLKFLQ